MGEEERNGWTIVRRRRRSMRKTRVDEYSDKWWRKNRDEEVTYFFSEFPENFGAKEMFRAFEKYGKVVDVVIPAKRDKMGRRFGFARFVGVSDVKLFGIKLDNIIIGATKLFVNAPRFEREETLRRGFQQQGIKSTTNTLAEKYGGGYLLYQWKEKKRVEGEESRRDTRTETEAASRRDIQRNFP